MTSPAIEDVLRELYRHYGRPAHSGPDDLLGTLVQTILSQQTTAKNARRAFGALIDRFGGDWHRIARAPAADVQDAIAVAGLAGQKGPRIQAALGRIRDERGGYDLEFLRELDAQAALAWLTRLKGVGPKTARFVLMDAAGMDVFPMDTHILRICERLGWTAPGTSSKKAHTTMEPQIPAGEHYAAHVAIIRHGRQTCHARTPDCGACPIAALCPWEGKKP